MEQHGFFYDQSRCCGCRACTVACKNWQSLPPGPVKFLRVYEYEKGTFPDVRLHFYWVPCYHCEKPACVDACPQAAIHKEDKFGAVLLDSTKCDGCRLCYDVCPYGAPMFESDDAFAKAQKCDMCYDRLERGEKPICVLSCAFRALDFGTLPELIARYGNNRDLEEFPDSAVTKPAVIFKTHVPKKPLLPYDSAKTKQLMMRRGELPQLFNSPQDLNPGSRVGRSGLVIKHDSVDELMSRTCGDEG